LSAGNYAGVINISMGFSDEYLELLKTQLNFKSPLVFVDDYSQFGHRIYFDTRKAIVDATRHLAAHDYRLLALINCPADWSVGREVSAGFQQGLLESSLDFSRDLIYSVPDFTFAAGKFCGERILQNSPIPRAVVTAGDALALGAISAFKDAGLRIPQDIAVIGYNDIPVSAISDPPLTTVAMPTFRIGEVSIRTLLKIIDGSPQKWLIEKFAGELQIRKSCGC
jgi:DNA-binding LacI/PurR family transcriptional regulator